MREYICIICIYIHRPPESCRFLYQLKLFAQCPSIVLRMDADNGDDAGSSGRYSSLDVRQAVRRAIMCGDIKGATERIHAAGYSKASFLMGYNLVISDCLLPTLFAPSSLIRPVSTLN